MNTSEANIKELVDTYIEKIVIKGEKIRFYLVEGDYEMNVNKYPKRVDGGGDLFGN